MNDGSYWGVTTIDGKQGWVNLDEVNNPDQQEGTESGEMSDSTENGKTPGKTDSALSSEDAETSDTAVSVVQETGNTFCRSFKNRRRTGNNTFCNIGDRREAGNISCGSFHNSGCSREF